ncbi:exonuclease v-like [Plakobranchus ocellatus]|uniref:Exonuclease v-like n=1 Tax=Plakobranchus ocellatus TaxID=259542 RepID=A0AAV3ZY68_9GAST|nr:exonuclease v-like [Plakobranchus ocellatus]
MTSELKDAPENEEQVHRQNLVDSASPNPEPSGSTTNIDNCDLWSDADEDELVKLDYDENFQVSGCSAEWSLECDKIVSENGSPKNQFRPGYFIVSDFARQQWCEMQLLYSFAPEIILMRVVPGEEVKIEESEEAKAVKSKGTSIHLERELEIQVPVPVVVKTKEDKWAVKLINLQQAVLAFCRGQRLAREIPVFGCPFGSDIFVYGIIDELRYDPDKHDVHISELKTRKSFYSPKKGQQDKDKYQVNLYAQLFNELVAGKVSADMVASHLHLDLNKALGPGVLEHIQDVDTGISPDTCSFGELLEMVLSQVQSLCCIRNSRVEYIHQDSKTEILVLEVTLDAEALQQQFLHHCEWWHGNRGTTGVDIEDCWKCEHCQFSPLCEWRDFMANRLGNKKKAVSTG